jgi:F-type H+-transporting ATPase subunit alpha
LRVEQQVAIIYLGTKGLLSAVPVNKIREFEADFLNFMENKHIDVLNTIKKGGIGDDVTGILESVCKELTAKYSA